MLRRRVADLHRCERLCRPSPNSSANPPRNRSMARSVKPLLIATSSSALDLFRWKNPEQKRWPVRLSLAALLS